MKKIFLLVLITILFISCVTTSSDQSDIKASFSSDEYSVKSFERNSNGYLLTFLSIDNSVPSDAIIHITVGNSGEGKPYQKGMMKYQFGDLNIPATGSFDIEFGIGRLTNNQMKIGSIVSFKRITIDDIASGLDNPAVSSGQNLTGSNSNLKQNQDMDFIDYTGLNKRAELFKRIHGDIIFDSTGFLDYYSNSEDKNFVRLKMENINNPNNNTSTEYSFTANGTLESAAKVSSHLRNQAFYFPVNKPRVIAKQMDENNHLIINGKDFNLQMLVDIYDLSQDDIVFYISNWGNSISYDAIIVNSYREGILGIVGVGNLGDFVDKWDGGGNPDMDSFTYIFYSPDE